MAHWHPGKAHWVNAQATRCSHVCQALEGQGVGSERIQPGTFRRGGKPPHLHPQVQAAATDPAARHTLTQVPGAGSGLVS